MSHVRPLASIALALIVAGGTAPARATGLETPLRPELIDVQATAEWVDGHETPRVHFLDQRNARPNEVTWFMTTPGVPLGGNGISFGTSARPGPRHLRVGLKAPIAAGSILTCGNIDHVSVLRPEAAYPGDMAAASSWIEATRQSEGQLSLWILPPGTATRALRFTFTATASDQPTSGHLRGATLIAARVANVAPAAIALASSHQATAARLVDGEFNLWDAWDNDDGARVGPPSPSRPEWVMLIWPEAVAVRGLCVISPLLGKTEVQTFVGPDGLHPREATDDHWRTIATPTFPSRYPETLADDWVDFGGSITTRAVRLRMIGPPEGLRGYLYEKSHDRKRVWLGELMALESLGDRPVPTVARAALDGNTHPPIAVPFTMPAAGYATLVLEDARGHRVRNLVADTWFDAGPQTAWWDGLDESGRLEGPYAGIYKTVGAPVAPGAYRARGLYHGALEVRYELSPYSPGSPPWPTGGDLDHGTGGWLSDHGNPAAALSLPGPRPRLLFASPVAEASYGLMWTDLEGRKVDGKHWLGAWTGASHLARDDGPRALPGNDAYAGVAWQGELRLTALHADGSFTPIAAQAGLSPPVLGGLAARDGVLFASLPHEGQLVTVDVARDRVLGRAPLADGRGLAFDGRGHLLALAGRRLLVFAGATPPALGASRVLVDGLEDPRALTTDAAGNIYVADWGRSQQVKVFDPEGRPLRTIGQPGGAVVGPYDPRRMDRPAGLAIAADGRLWVAEDSAAPKRISAWTAAGELVKAFYGPPQYGGGGAIDPRDPTRFYYAGKGQDTGLELSIDWTTGHAALRAIYWLGGVGQTAALDDTGPETAIYVGGRQYMTDVFNARGVGGPLVGSIWLMRGDRAVRVAAFGRVFKWPLLATEPFRGRWPPGVDKDGPNGVVFAWSDLNGDGAVSPDEVTIAIDPVGSLTVNERLEFCTASAKVYAPVGFTAAGVPRYDATRASAQKSDYFMKEVWSGSGQVMALRDGWTFASGGPVRGFRGGDQVWTYPNEYPSQQAAVSSLPPTHAGELMATSRLIGQTIEPAAGHVGDVGEIVALAGDLGDVFLMTADGLFVATLFHDLRDTTATWSMPAAPRGLRLEDITIGPEAFWTNISQTGAGDVYVIAGRNHSSVARVTGLETLRRLDAPSVTVTPAGLARAEAYRTQEEWERQRRMGSDLRNVGITKKRIAVDGDLADWSDAQWVVVDARPGRLGDALGRVEAAVAISGERLYVAYRSRDKALLANTGESGQMLFATGGALDLMLGADPSADPARAAPVAGDVRLVATRVRGQTKATLYRPLARKRRGRPVSFSSPWRTVKMDEVDDVSGLVELAQRDGNYEVSIPLAALGLAPTPGVTLRGDVGILRGDGVRTVQRLYWQNKTTSTASDIPTEATLTPRLWGRMRIGGR